MRFGKLLQVFHLQLNRPCPVEYLLAERRDEHLAVVAFEYLEAELLLHLGQRGAQRGLADVALFRGTLEVQVPFHGQGIMNLLK